MVEVKFLTMPGCHNCAKAKAILEKIKKEMPDLKVEEINLVEHPEVAAEYSVMASPGIVIDGKLEFTGGVTEEQLREKLEEAR